MRVVVNGWFHASLAAGSGQYLAALATWLPGIAHEHEFILVRGGPAARLAAPVPSSWRVHDVPAGALRDGKNLAKLWFEQVTFPSICRRLRADVAWVPYWGPPWWQPCPVVVTVHDLIPLLLPAYRGGWLQRGYTALVAGTARRASAVLTDSEASKLDIIRHLHIPAERVHAVPLAAEREIATTSYTEVRKRYRLPSEPFLLYLGGFDVRKNVERTLEGYARLVQRLASEDRTPPRLVVAGRLPSRDSAFAPDPRRIAENLAVARFVHFTGWIDERDKPALYKAALAIVFLSEYEGFGLPVLEAMAAVAGPN